MLDNKTFFIEFKALILIKGAAEFTTPRSFAIINDFSSIICGNYSLLCGFYFTQLIKCLYNVDPILN